MYGPERKVFLLLNAGDWLLWASGLIGHLLLLGVLFYRRRAARFPVFTALIGANVLRTTVLFCLRNFEGAYRIAYITTALVDAVIVLVVIYEIASHVFRPLGRWALDIRHGMFWLIGMSVAVACALTWLAGPDARGWKHAFLVKTSFFSSALMAELFMGMVVLSVTVGLPWKTHVARIAHGLGVFAILDAVIAAGHTAHGSLYGTHVDALLTRTRMLVYLACVLYWIVALWEEAPTPRDLPPKMLAELRSLNARVAYDLYTLRKWRKP